MSKITIQLTEDQVNQVLRSLEWGLYPDNPTTEEKKHNAFVIRTMYSIVKQEVEQRKTELAKAKTN